MELQDYKKPDLNAPRFFDQSLDVTTKGFYPEMVAKYPNLSKYTSREIITMLKGFNTDVVATAIVSTRDGVKLPNSLGNIFMGFFKSKYHKELDIDTPTSWEVGKKVHHSNYDTDGHIPYIYYAKYTGSYKFPFLNAEYWSFEPCREMTRNMKKYINEDWKKYIIVESKSTIKKMVEGIYYKRKKQREDKVQLQTYDPFKIEED